MTNPPLLLDLAISHAGDVPGHFSGIGRLPRRLVTT